MVVYEEEELGFISCHCDADPKEKLREALGTSAW